METDGGVWEVFQRRFNGSVDFYKDWDSCKSGFGNPSGEYWLGNEKINLLTSSGKEFAYSGNVWNGAQFGYEDGVDASMMMIK